MLRNAPSIALVEAFAASTARVLLFARLVGIGRG